MVMDNDEARIRHGVQPTYKGKNGFQPLQMIWGRFIIDAVFRGGKKHGNHGYTVEKMVLHVVHNIRTKYRSDVPIIMKMNSGFFDQKLFEVFEKLNVGYVVSGKLYDDIKEYAKKVKCETWQQYQNKEQIWDYAEFMDKRGSWNKARRAIYCSPRQKGAQLLLEFARPDTILYTKSKAIRNRTSRTNIVKIFLLILELLGFSFFKFIIKCYFLKSYYSLIVYEVKGVGLWPKLSRFKKGDYFS